MSGKAQRAPAKPTAPPDVHTLQSRWDAARKSSQQPNHRKVELICCHCHSRTFNNKTECKECQAPLATAWTLLPQQWPPLGVPQQILDRFEGDDSRHDNNPCPVAVEEVRAAGAELGLNTLTTAQLRVEAAALERYLRETEGTETAMRTLARQNQAALRAEIALRKPTGKRLDAAETKLKASQEALQVAETHHQDALAALRNSEQALLQAKQQVKHDEEGLAKLKEQLQETTPPAQAPLPTEVTRLVMQLLTSAGLAPEHLTALTALLRVPEPAADNGDVTMAAAGQQEPATPVPTTPLPFIGPLLPPMVDRLLTPATQPQATTQRESPDSATQEPRERSPRRALSVPDADHPRRRKSPPRAPAKPTQ